MSVQDLLLALDAGGTSTRALLLRSDGTVLGRGRSGAGNPTSAGSERALASVAAASAEAVTGADPARVSLAVLAMAGEQHLLGAADLRSALGVGPATEVRVVSDVLAMFRSGADEPTGAAVVSGTGSNAARVEDGVVVRAVGGAGWLLGDGGSGFAIGHAIVRAVVAAEHGLGPRTSLAGPVLAGVGGDYAGLVRHTYAERPVALARLAPLAFEHAATDAVAAAVVAAAQDDLAALIARVAGPGDPLVVGGSVAHHGLLAPGRSRTPALTDALRGLDLRSARDGAQGAAVAALALHGGEPSAEVLARVRSGAV
ncbi:N-acetylglucosamine kinase [Kineococcus gynurae]|uniref:N-acetylglucosamine kinase n=1 Tax=Kineococcus gynurae TaxID=452979 RepID=A0ABV5LQE6_9ACTN